MTVRSHRAEPLPKTTSSAPPLSSGQRMWPNFASACTVTLEPGLRIRVNDPDSTFSRERPRLIGPSTVTPPAWLRRSETSTTSLRWHPPAVTRTRPKRGTPVLRTPPVVASTSMISFGLTLTSSSLPKPMSRRSSRLRGGRIKEKPLRLGPNSPVELTSITSPLRRSTCGPSTDRVATDESPSIRTRRPTAVIETRTSPPGLPFGVSSCSGPD